MTDDNLSDVIKTSANDAHTAKVLPFKGVTPKVTAETSGEAIVKMLEGYIERAKAGEVVFLAVAVVDGNNIAQTSWEPEVADPVTLSAALGSVAFLSYRFSASVNKGAVAV